MLTRQLFFILFSITLSGVCFADEKKPVSLIECEKTAVETHDTIRLAREEAEVAKFKRSEAFRDIFPKMDLKAEQTKGDADNANGSPDFTEQSYTAQMSQPLFQGWKLYRTYQQADANYESLKFKYEKARQDILYGVRETFWNLVKAQESLAIYKNALVDIAIEKLKAEQLFQEEIINRQIYLTIVSQFRQAQLQTDSAEAEVESKLWQWTAALGLKSPPDWQPSYSTQTVTSESPALNLCLSMAKTNHPDILIQKKTMEAAEHGAKAASGYLWPALDFNGSYGRSGGAFASEDLNLTEDWQVGLKMTMNFSGNSLGFSGFDQKTSKKLGQSSRTRVETLSANAGIFDTLKNKTEKKDAEFVYHQAQVQMDRTLIEVANNVREAYANYKKALTQLKIAENDLDLAKVEYDVSEIKSGTKDAPLSEKAVARNKLAQAQVGLADARAGYSIAVAALNRAVGVPDFLTVKN